MERRKTFKKVAKAAGYTAASAGTAAAGWVAYSRFFVDHKRKLGPALEATVEWFSSAAAGTLGFYPSRGAPGRPLVLLHSINAAASSYEMKPLFGHYHRRRPVFALDLPGFGFSDRGEREYSPGLYADAIAEFIETELADEGPADVIAYSLTSEFAARAALNRPELFRSLTMISPTGFSARKPRASEAAYKALSAPLWSQAFYDLLVSRPSLRYYLGKSFEGPVDPGLLEYDYDTSHQPQARFAPLAFISGKLFTPDIRTTVYEQLRLPVLVLYDRDGYITFDFLREFTRRPNWRVERIPNTKAAPHFEKLADTVQVLDRFWKSIVAAAGG